MEIIGATRVLTKEFELRTIKSHETNEAIHIILLDRELEFSGLNRDLMENLSEKRNLALIYLRILLILHPGRLNKSLLDK